MKSETVSVTKYSPVVQSVNKIYENFQFTIQ
jgi:hypothetical protein